MTETEIASQLYACVNQAGNSIDKRRYMIEISAIVSTLARDIHEESYQPGRMTAFAVQDPKLREIFAPGFRDRLAQQWLVSVSGPSIERAWIDDCFSNRIGKGTHSAIRRLQHFMRMPSHSHYCQMDIRSFFTSINRHILLAQWKAEQIRLPYPEQTLRQLDAVAQKIILQNPIFPKPALSGNIALLKQIPPHKSLFHSLPNIGLPIGSLSSQFFSNVYLNPLDQYVKHQLKIRGYLRYVDDIIILGTEPKKLLEQMRQINQFLKEHLQLQLHPDKTVLQRVDQGANFLGFIVFPHYRYVRERTLRALRSRIYFFNYLFDPVRFPHGSKPHRGTWPQWLALHQLAPPLSPSPVVLKRMLATLNSYYGQLVHADTYHLRRKIYNEMLGPIKRYFLPTDANYGQLHIKKVWLISPP
jgi:hypothetical protein